MPATHKRYLARYNEFLQWAGNDSGFTASSRIAVLQYYMTRLALDNAISRATDSGNAVGFFWKTKYGFDPQADATFANFCKGLRRLAPLLRTSRPLRNDLPVSALLHFFSSPPAGIDPDLHILIAAALSYAMRAIQRGGQVADLECCDVFTTSLPSAGRVARTGLPADLALRVIVRTSKTDTQGVRPYEIIIDQGVSAVDPISRIDHYARMRFGIPLTLWNQSVMSRSQSKFFTYRGAAISTDCLREWVRLVARHAGLSGTYGSHSLRIAGACWAAVGGLSLETIMSIGGWKSISSTTLYLRSLIAAASGASARMGF